MSILAKELSFKQLLHNHQCLTGVGARDALDARLIESTGFDFVWASSFCISAANCVPDASILSMPEFLAAAKRMRESVSIPILFDADTGYGGEKNVAYATRRISETGISGLCMEDKCFPKQTSLLPGAEHSLVSVGEFRRKIVVALEARFSSDFLIMARTESLIAGLGESEALERAYAYQDAGAEALLIHSKSESPDEILSFVAAWKGHIPLAIVPTSYPTLTEDKAKELGKIGFVIYGNQAVRAAISGTQAALSEIRKTKGAHTLNGQLASMSAVLSLQGDQGKEQR